jgi:hypothetical protein
MLAIALCLAVTLIVTDGAYVTAYTCRNLNLSVRAFMFIVWRRPLLCVLPFAFWLLVARGMFEPIAALASGGIGGGAILGAMYWRWILPESARSKLKKKGVSFLKAVRSRFTPGLKEAPVRRDA